MRKKTLVQLVALVGVALGTAQLSGVTVHDQPARSSALSSAGMRPRMAFAKQTAPRITGNARLRVNGRTNPEQVPDELAFRLYMKSITLLGTPTAQDVLRQKAFLKQLDLPAADEKLFADTMGGISPELTHVEGERKQLTKDDPAGLSKQISLKGREDRALDNALATLTGRLSAEAWSKFNAHVRGHVKKSIVVVEVVSHDAH